MDIIESYSRIYTNLVESGGHSATCIFNAIEQFNTEDRKEIASRLHEVFQFNFESYSVQGMIRGNLQALSPDADLSWIPDWRKDYEALHASTENTN